MYKKIWVKAKNARQSLVARRRMGQSIFSPIRPRGNNSDSESDDDDEEEEEVDVDSDSIDGDDNEGSLSLMNENDSELTSFHRACSEGSPVSTPRRRSFSQNEMWH